LTKKQSIAKLTQMRAINITVAGQSFEIRSDAKEDYVRQLAADITKRFVALREKGPRHNQDFKAMAMVAIGLLDELYSAKKERESIQEKTRQFAMRIISRIDKLLAGESS
jgi:cell division protein ZapA (FtsZ GTPase activity inhibitor)